MVGLLVGVPLGVLVFVTVEVGVAVGKLPVNLILSIHMVALGAASIWK